MSEQITFESATCKQSLQVAGGKVMSELTEEQRAFLVGDNARMEGYYVGFYKTGVDVIDQVLSAVAYAAKGAHSTDGWTIELGAAYGPVPADKTFEWLIQEAANDAAERLAAAGLAPQPEPEYEYRCVHPRLDVTMVVRSNDWEEHSRKCPGVIERRVKAGAWERAGQEEQS